MTEGQEQEAILELDFMIYDAIQASVPVGTTYRYEEQGNHYYDHNGVITNSYSMLRFRETLHIAEVTKGPGHYLSPDGFTLQSREPVPNQILSWEITFKGPASFKDGIRTCVELSDGFDVDDGTRVQIPDTFEFKEFLWPNVYTPLKALGITSVEKLGSLYTQRFFLEFFGIEVCLDHSILPRPCSLP